MKTKGIITLMMTAILISCQEDNDNDQGRITVRIGAAIDSKDCLYSRANAQGDEEISRCLVQIVINGETQDIISMTGNEADGFTLETTLYKGKSYDFYFWADRGEAFYNASDLTSISLVASQKPTVAYHGKYSFASSDAITSFSTTLSHAVAKISYLTTTPLEGGKAVTMTLSRVFPTFNVATGLATGDSSTRSYGISLSEQISNNSVVFSEYAFVDNEVQNVELSYTYAPAVTVSNVPIMTNVHTTLQGDISNKATLGVTATIASSWENEVNQNGEEDDDEEEDLGGVDLGDGISVIWAECNLGATTPMEFGNYYQWGITSPCEPVRILQDSELPVHVDTNRNLIPEYDAATANDSHWRMPTKNECLVLYNLTKEIITEDGVNAIKFIGSNGNYIILPCAGGYSIFTIFTNAKYWSSTFDKYQATYDLAYCMDLSPTLSNISMSSFMSTEHTCYKLSIRPVRDKNKD